jgi:hypothetical protein
MVAPILVLMRADLTGGMMVPFVMLVDATQLDQRSDVQSPLAVRLITLLVVISVSSWRVGLM